MSHILQFHLPTRQNKTTVELPRTGKPVFSACSHTKYVTSRNSALRTGKERNSLMLGAKLFMK